MTNHPNRARKYQVWVKSHEHQPRETDMQIGTKVQDRAAGQLVGEIVDLAKYKSFRRARGRDPMDALVLWPNGKTTWVPVQFLTAGRLTSGASTRLTQAAGARGARRRRIK